jgi:hypothetical protein
MYIQLVIETSWKIIVLFNSAVDCTMQVRLFKVNNIHFNFNSLFISYTTSIND